MKHRLPFFVGLTVVVVGAALISALVSGVIAQQYEPAQLSTVRQVVSNPHRYIGHLVRLRGYLGSEPGIDPSSCNAKASAGCSPIGISDGNGGNAVLWLRPTRDPFMQLLRSLPLLGKLVPPPQLRQGGQGPYVYRVRIRILPTPCRSLCLYGEVPDSY